MATKSYTNTHSYSYNGNNEDSGDIRSDKTDYTAYQGWYQNISRGSQFSYVLFNGSQIASDMSGATISKVTLTITLAHSYDSSGNFRTIAGYSTRTFSSVPSAITSHATYDFMNKQNWYQKASDQGGGSYTTDITSWAAAAFQTGGAYCIMFGDDTTTASPGDVLANYGYFSSAPGQATLTFTYTTYSPPSFPDSTVPDGTVGISYSTTNTEATVPDPPATYSISSGSLPAGLGLNTSSGLLSGTPTTAGNYSFTVKVVQHDGQSATQAFTQTINILAPTGNPPPVSGPYSLASAQISTAATTSGAITVQTTGYDNDVYVVYVATNDSTTGRAEVSSITDTQGNTYSLQSLSTSTGLAAEPEVQVYMATGVTALVSGTDTITVNLLNSVTFSVVAVGIVGTATLDKAVCNTPQTSTTPSASTGTLSDAYEYVLGTWIAGPNHTISSLAGCTTLLESELPTSGAPCMEVYWDGPNGTSSTGAVNFSGTLNASATWNCVALSFITAPPIFTSATFGNGIVGSRYSSSAGAASVTSGSTTYAIDAGSLPSGLSIASGTGIVSGTPTTPGIFSFGILATDANGNSSGKSGTITIGPLVYGHGANNVTPTIPQFVMDETSVDNLNNLAYAVDFLCDDNTRPVYKAFKPYASTFSSYGWNNITLGDIAFDSDGQGGLGTSNMQTTIVTTGYYCCEGAASLKNGATGGQLFKIRFVFTPGASNPIYSSAIYFGQRAMGTDGSTSTDTSLCANDICPAVCYPGDTIALQVWIPTSTLTLDYNNNTAFNQGRFVVSFSTYYLRLGA